MPLNFPSNAINGDVYTGTNNILYTYDGTKWNASGQQGSIIPSANLTYDLGSTSSQWRHLYVGTSTIYIGGTPVTVDAGGQLIINGSPITGVPANVGDLSFVDTTIYSTTGVRVSNRGISTTATAQIIVPEINDNVQPIELRNVVGSVGINTGIDENNLQSWEFGRQGTLAVPNRNTITFTAICDPNHAAGDLTLSDAPWTFEVTFKVLADGIVETHIPNWSPWGSNPGYTSGQQFSYLADDHGIPGYTFELTLIDIQNPGPFMYTTNLAVNAPPEYPSTFNSQGAVKITAGQKDWTLSSSGDLVLPSKWPIAFTAQFDEAHYSGFGQLQGDGSVSFNLELQGMGTTFQWAADDPTYETNRGYIGTQEFQFKDVDHGITGYVLTINMSMAGDDEQGWSLNVTLSADPTVANLAKIRSVDELMIRSGSKGWLFDTNGDIYLPSGGDIRDSAGTSVLGGGFANTSTLINGTATVQLLIGGGNNPYTLFPEYEGGQLYIQGGELSATGSGTVAISGGAEGGSILLSTYGASLKQWAFDTLGTLMVPGTIRQGDNYLNLNSPGTGIMLLSDTSTVKIITDYATNGGSGWTFDTDLSLRVPGNIVGFDPPMGYERLVLQPSPAVQDSFLFYVDQTAGTFNRAGIEMPYADEDKAVTLAFPHNNNTVGYIFNQGTDTISGTALNNALNIMMNAGDVKITALSAGPTYTSWTFQQNGGLKFPDGSTSTGASIYVPYATSSSFKITTVDDNMGMGPYQEKTFEVRGNTLYLPGPNLIADGELWQLNSSGYLRFPTGGQIVYGDGLNTLNTGTLKIFAFDEDNHGQGTAVVINTNNEQEWRFKSTGELTFPDGTTSTGASIYVPYATSSSFKISTQLPPIGPPPYGATTFEVTAGRIILPTGNGFIQSGNYTDPWSLDSANKGLYFPNNSRINYYEAGGALSTGSMQVDVRDGGIFQIVLNDSNKTWSFNNNGFLTFPDGTTSTTAWTKAAASVQSTPPASPVTGQLYYDTDDGRTYIYTGAAWIDSNPAGAGGGVTSLTAGTGTFVSTSTGAITLWTGNTANLKETFETKNASTGTTTHDCTTNRLFYLTNLGTNFTPNFTNLSLSSGDATSVSLVVVQTSTARSITGVQIASTTSGVTLTWQGSATAPAGNASRTEVFTFSILCTATNAYTVLGMMTSFGGA